MKMGLIRNLTAALVMTLGAASAANASVIIVVQEVGPDVTFTATGSLDISALSPIGSFGSGINGFVQPSFGVVTLGETPTPTDLINYDGLAGPTSFGTSAATTSVTSGSGLNLGIGASSSRLQLPIAYAGESLASETVFAGMTIDGLGLTPGSYLWEWGSADDGNYDSVRLNIGASAVPIPAALPLFLSALSFMGFTGWRKRKQA